MGIFDKYKNEEKKVEIDGEEIVIRKLTNKEANEIQELMLGDSSSKELQSGDVVISVGKLREVQILTVSYALVEPKMTKEKLEKLPEESFETIQKIYEAIQEFNKPKK